MARKVIGISQPRYFPWLGYLQQMSRCDEWIYLIDVQLSKRVREHRVKVMSSAGTPKWLTLPVNCARGQHITSVSFAAEESDWPTAHFERLRQSYRLCPYWEETLPLLEAVYALPRQMGLAHFLIHEMELLHRHIDLPTKHLKLNDQLIEAEGTGVTRLLNICELREGNVYLSGPLGRDYIDAALFESAGIELEFMAFKPKPYSQASQGRDAKSHFTAGLSCLDALFNIGREKTRDHILDY